MSRTRDGARRARSRDAGPLLPGPPERAPAPAPGWLLAALALLAMLVTVVVQRRVLDAYFTPDDLLQLARARDLVPWPVSAWRWLSGYALAHLTTGTFGADPRPYHALNLGLLALSAALLCLLARRWGASPAAAFAAAALFGASRVHFTALAATSWASEFLSLVLLLAALLVIGPSRRRGAAAALLLVAALSAKEGVLLLPLVLLLLPGEAGASRGPRRGDALALAALGLVAGAAFILDGRSGGRFGGGAYETALGPNLWTSLFTLLKWSVDVRTPIPDIATNPDPGAWIVGLPALLAIVAVVIAARRKAPYAVAGAAWWLLAVLPVLPLLHQTYLHYLVTAFAGLSLVAAAALDAWVLPRAAGRGRVPPRDAGWRALAIAGVLVVAWAFAQDRLLEQRWTARLPGGDTPTDPVLRKGEYARRLIGEVERALDGRPARVAYFILEGAQERFDLRTGEVSPGTVEELGALRNTVVTVLGGGTSLRAVVPTVDSVAFVTRLETSLSGFDCFLPNREHHVQYLGQPPEALERLANGLILFDLPGPAVRLLEVATREWPDRPGLLWSQAVGLARLGERDRARGVLREVVRVAPADSFAAMARAALASEEGPR